MSMINGHAQPHLHSLLPTWFPSLSQHLLIGVAAVLLYVLSVRSRRDRRAPAAAISWVMGLALLPYLVLPLYFLFGQRKLAAKQPPRYRPHDADAPWATTLLASFGLAPPSPAKVRFHANGVEARDALWELIDGARESLDVCTFLIGDDGFGRAAILRLALRARAGVRVRLLLDGLGGWSSPRAPLRELEAAGGQVVIFRPLFGWRRLGPRNLRNHRKLTLADGRHLWAGGRNLATEYFTGEGRSAPWIDLSFDLEGGVVAAAALQFEADWQAARGSPAAASGAATPSDAVGGALAQFLPSGPDQCEDTAQALLVDACYRARKRLLAVTPYFVPDESLKTALRIAVRRGVQLTLVLPERSNHPLTDFVRTRALRELAEAGARVRLVPAMVHAKAVVVDEVLAVSGSINLDLRSLLLNHECAVVFYGAREVQWLATWIEALADKGDDFIPKRPGVIRDVLEGLLLTVAFQL